MQKILLVEDVEAIGLEIKENLEERFKFTVYWAKNYKDTVKLLDKYSEFFMAIVDYNLPDAPDGKAINTVLKKQISTIIFTDNSSLEVRKQIWEKDVSIIDYILKEKKDNAKSIYNLVKRVRRNLNTKVLIVDDSKKDREYIKRLLRKYKFNIFETENGKDALKILSLHKDIKLIVVDYTMNPMNGIDLTCKIREEYPKHKISIIGLSEVEEHILPTKFIQSGANDFLKKPFSSEEFYCRIVQSVENIEYIYYIKKLLNTDHLTKLNNRKYFFDNAPALYKNCKKKDIPVAVAMMDIDFFKKINDTLGHDAGDQVLVFVAQIFLEMFNEDSIVCRSGGEEFCVITKNVNQNAALDLYEELRKRIENHTVLIGKEQVNVTVSIGICIKYLNNIDEMIKKSDEMLYESKNSGRNKITIFK